MGFVLTLNNIKTKEMKSILLSAACLCFLHFTCEAQSNSTNNPIDKAKSTVSGVVNTVTNTVNTATGKTLTNDEIVKGLKEALSIGAKNSVAKASLTDGFYKNAKIKIPFPAEVQDVEKKVRQLGMNKECDKFVATLNKAAEMAAKDAAPIFLNAITKMSISDGLKILNGNNDAATQFLKANTTNELIVVFSPIVKKALDQVMITQYWSPIVKKYNKIPMVRPVNPDLVGYTTKKAIEGLFVLIAEEEAKIRLDPMAQITDLLKKVFGKP